MSSTVTMSPRSETSSETVDKQRIQDMNRAYRAKKERIDCLWDRHVETKNKKSGGVVVEWVFERKEARQKGWTDNCFYCLDRASVCRNHQVRVDKEELGRLMKSDREVLLP